MLSTQPRKAIRSLFPPLAQLPSEAWEQLVREGRADTVPAETVLFDAETPCRAFPLLLSGSVRVVQRSEEGREVVLYRIRPGEMCLLSINCLLGASAYPASGIAEEEITVVQISLALFETLVSQASGFRSFVFRLLAGRLQELMQLVDAIAFQRLDRRLAALLLSRETPLKTTHQKLADELGTVRVMVSRLLERFESAGLVGLGRERIEILDAEALHCLTSPD